MAQTQPLWAGKASTAAATSKAPDMLNFCGRGTEAQDAQVQKLRVAKVSCSLEKIDLCKAWPFLWLQEPRAQGWSVRAIRCLT